MLLRILVGIDRAHRALRLLPRLALREQRLPDDRLRIERTVLRDARLQARAAVDGTGGRLAREVARLSGGDGRGLVAARDGCIVDVALGRSDLRLADNFRKPSVGPDCTKGVC